MNVFVSLGILILSVLIIASLKLIPGVFAFLYHYASGKYSAKKVSDLSMFFIFGVELFPAIIFVILNLIFYALSYTNLDPSNGIFLWAVVGLLIALGIAFFCFYYRRGHGTKLFISRRTASNFEQKAKLVKTRSDAFILGFISGIPELLFTLPLYLITLLSVTKNFLDVIPRSLILVLFILIIISPLLFLYAYFRSGNNLANYLKARIKNKLFFRFFISILYFVLAIIIIIFKVIF
ncbi:hypothetical protein IKF85_01075 [Candidatus Saccharibacteria bacterium]|nr:hypothetical protein [Candidatus Saccharibacteria bacterium]